MIYTRFNDIPPKHYGVVAADPPWKFKTFGPPKAGASSRQPRYPTMDVRAIKALPVREIAAPDCWLMLWCSWPFLEWGMDTLKAWGFRYSSSFKVWLKLHASFSETRLFVTLPTGETSGDFHMGTGYTTRKNSEFVLLGRRGSPKVLTKREREVMISPLREHSRKPDDFQPACQRFAAGPYMELFARAEIPGWDQFGNECEKFVVPTPPAILLPAPEPQQISLIGEDAA